MTDITKQDHDTWPPERTIFPIRSLTLSVHGGTHPFHRSEGHLADKNWHHEVAATPAIFNGQIVFQHRLTMKDGVIEGQGYLMPYSSFLWWRKQEPARGGFHLFGFPVLVSSDGAIIAIKMATHTVNAGKVYCAAGSLDQSDVVDGFCDLDGNMAREVKEETGLDLALAIADQQLIASHRRRRFTVYRLYRFDRSAETMMAEIRGHMQMDAEKEIADVVAIRNADPAAHNYDPAMLPLLSWIFREGT